MKEICEELTVCNPDQRSFKAYLSAWMARTTQLAPFTYNKIMPYLRSSAVAAGKQYVPLPICSEDESPTRLFYIVPFGVCSVI